MTHLSPRRDNYTLVVYLAVLKEVSINFKFSIENSFFKKKNELIFIEIVKDYFNSFGTMSECRLVKCKNTSKYIQVI